MRIPEPQFFPYSGAVEALNLLRSDLTLKGFQPER